MTVEEIYKHIAEHMIKGLMIHDQLADYYDFLGLNGYRKCHEYHYMDEAYNYRRLCRYFINHHNKLIEIGEIQNPDIIPGNWYRYSRQEIDSNTKKNAVKTGLNVWVEWEKETKTLYQNMYAELVALNEFASASKILCFIKDVDCELKKAERYRLYKESINYDIAYIISEQDEKYKIYKKKIEEFWSHDKY